MTQQHPVYAYGPPPQMRQEVPILTEQGVTVTTARFVVYQQTYPIAGLTSVAPFATPPDRSTATLAGCIFALVTLLFLLAGSVGPTLFFLAVVGLCIFVALQKKASYGVVVWTAGTNMRALVTHDKAFADRVVAALNQAIASR